MYFSGQVPRMWSLHRGMLQARQWLVFAPSGRSGGEDCAISAKTSHETVVHGCGAGETDSSFIAGKQPHCGAVRGRGMAYQPRVRGHSAPGHYPSARGGITPGALMMMCLLEPEAWRLNPRECAARAAVKQRKICSQVRLSFTEFVVCIRKYPIHNSREEGVRERRSGWV
jgi:hypothetical protein